MSMMPCDGYCYGSSVSVCKVLSFSVLAAGKRDVSAVSSLQTGTEMVARGYAETEPKRNLCGSIWNQKEEPSSKVVFDPATKI